MLHAHLGVGVRDELEGIQGESHGLVRPRDEPRGSRVSLAVQHTTMEESDDTLNHAR